jgi:inosine-uridine nucleoside N-ribohydrolase
MPVGPQTNLALALHLEPRLAQRIPRIVTMGGAYIEGNTTPSAEFNILADPEAAWLVFRSGIPITMIGLEVTAQALVKPEDARRVRAIGTPWAQIAAQLMELDIRWFQEHYGAEGGQIFDACTAAAVIDPALVVTRPMAVEIELQGKLTRGRTVADISMRRHQKPNVDVGVSIDRARFLKILEDGLR